MEISLEIDHPHFGLNSFRIQSRQYLANIFNIKITVSFCQMGL